MQPSTLPPVGFTSGALLLRKSIFSSATERPYYSQVPRLRACISFWLLWKYLFYSLYPVKHRSSIRDTYLFENERRVGSIFIVATHNKRPVVADMICHFLTSKWIILLAWTHLRKVFHHIANDTLLFFFQPVNIDIWQTVIFSESVDLGRI